MAAAALNRLALIATGLGVGGAVLQQALFNGECGIISILNSLKSQMCSPVWADRVDEIGSFTASSELRDRQALSTRHEKPTLSEGTVSEM